MKYRDWKWTVEATVWCICFCAWVPILIMGTIWAAFLAQQAFETGLWPLGIVFACCVVLLCGGLLLVLYGIGTSAREAWFGRA